MCDTEVEPKVKRIRLKSKRNVCDPTSRFKISITWFEILLLFDEKKILIGRKSRFSVFPINFVNFLSNFFSHGKSFFLSHRKQKKISFRVQSNENHFQRIFPLNWVCYFIALENLFYSCKDLTPAGRQTKDLSIRLYQT